MGGGDSGGTSTTVNSIPDELRPLAAAYTAKATELAKQPYVQYGGQRYADLNDIQNLGLGMVQDRAIGGSPTMTNAEGYLNQMMAGGANPYLDAMVNQAQQNVLANANQIQAMSGSFGNSGINEAAAKQMGNIATNMYGQAYAQDQNNRLQAIGMAPTYGNAAYTDASQLLNAGQLRQDQAQKNLDYGYQNYTEEQNLPYKQLAAMGGIFGSNLGSSSTTQQSGGGK